MPATRTIPWWQVDKQISDLGTDQEYLIKVQREAIPLVFLPGIMGTRLRKAGTDGTGKGPDGLPNMRWDPSRPVWMLRNVGKLNGPERKAFLVGKAFNPGFLEVANANPVGDGFEGIMSAYVKKFLKPLKEHDWGALNKIFEFPVYAVGYNWSDDNANSGRKLAARIKDIIKEAKATTGICDKVILISHSMGGLVSRWASLMAGAQGSVLGIIHGVQPVTGAPAAYWRMKAGFEALGFWNFTGRIASRVLGNSGPNVTPVLANVPGGLELLPNNHFKPNEKSAAWLLPNRGGDKEISLPKNQDPYSEIYQQKAIVRPTAGQNPSGNEYWRLVDPDLLDPSSKTAGPGKPLGPNDTLDAAAPPGGDPWPQYLQMLAMAKGFHDALGVKAHPLTYAFSGKGHTTANVVKMGVKAGKVNANVYDTRSFTGIFTDAAGSGRHAELRNPDDETGDGTVPFSSANALHVPGIALNVEHQDAYADKGVMKFVVECITAMCKVQFKHRRSG
jgi:PGAP1-like protein